MYTPLRKARRDAGRTIGEVADAVNVDRSTISRIERGEQHAGPALAERLVAFYKGAITELEVLYPERYARTDNE